MAACTQAVSVLLNMQLGGAVRCGGTGGRGVRIVLQCWLMADMSMGLGQNISVVPLSVKSATERGPPQGARASEPTG